MAKPVIAIGTSHGPQLVTEPRDWPQRVIADRRNTHFHRGRSYSFDELVALRADRDWAPQITQEVWQRKHDECQKAIADLADRFRAARPDVAVIFGNDQSEIFNDDNIPAFAVYAGEGIDNIPKSREQVANLPPGVGAAESGYCPPVAARYPGEPTLARHLIKELIAAEFDVAQMNRLPTGPRGHNGIPHAFGFVYRRIMRDDVIPSVPLFVNNYYEPNKPTVRRCAAFGRAVARAVRSFPGDMRVALIASGGLTHFAIDEELDRPVLAAMQAGDLAALERIPEEMFLSPGTGEIKNWIPLAAAMVELGMKMNLIDYVPCYRSEAGTGTAMAFAYWGGLDMAQLDATAKRRRFRELLRRPKLTVMPGGFGPLYARMAQEAGFESFFLPGSQLSGVLYGVPDNGIIGLRDLVDHARHMASCADIPILVDADTGFGNAVNVHYAVQEIVRSGVAALHIEDQEAPKKSGTAAGRRCIPLDEAVGKFQAAVAARSELDPEFVVCARCDALGAEGGGFDDALRRSVAYIEKGGADLVWLNSVETREQVRRAVKEVPGPLLVIWGGANPAPSPAEYEEMGVRIALYPTFCSTFAIQAVWQLLNDFRERGPDALAERSAEMRKGRWGLIDAKKLTGADKIPALEERYLPASAQRDYANTWGHKVTFEREGETKG